MIPTHAACMDVFYCKSICKIQWTQATFKLCHMFITNTCILWIPKICVLSFWEEYAFINLPIDLMVIQNIFSWIDTGWEKIVKTLTYCLHRKRHQNIKTLHHSKQCNKKKFVFFLFNCFFVFFLIFAKWANWVQTHEV